jgi:hypothetical protein
MATRPTPPPKRAATEEEKQAAAAKIAAALGQGNGVSENTGKINAAATPKAEEPAPATVEASPRRGRPPSSPRVTAVTPEAVPSTSSHTASADPPVASEPTVSAPAPTVDFSELAKVIGETIKKSMEPVIKKLQDQNVKVLEAVSAGIENVNGIGQLLAELNQSFKEFSDSPQAPESEARIEVRAIDHGAVRVMFAALPAEPEWIEDWSAAASEKYGVPAEELAQYAREFGFTELHEGPDGGESVCCDYDNPPGV